MDLKVLIVDDDPIMIMMQKRVTLKAFAADSLVAYNGEEALVLLEKEPADDEYLILLDINMPVMNGWEFLDAIQSHPFRNKMKVIMVTSSSDKLDKEKAFTYENVIGFYEKPFSIADLEQIKLLPQLAPYI